MNQFSPELMLAHLLGFFKDRGGTINIGDDGTYVYFVMENLRNENYHLDSMKFICNITKSNYMMHAIPPYIVPEATRQEVMTWICYYNAHIVESNIVINQFTGDLHIKNVINCQVVLPSFEVMYETMRFTLSSLFGMVNDMLELAEGKISLDDAIARLCN